MIETEWILGLVGGVIIGASAALLLFFNGRVFGVAGIVGSSFTPVRGDTSWRIMLIMGLLLGGVMFRFVDPSIFPTAFPRSTGMIVLAGLLVGFGSRLGNGCTSGHGVCGVARLSPRSLLATGVFTLSGMLVVLLMNQLLGGTP